MVARVLMLLALQGLPQAGTGSITGQIVNASGAPAAAVRVALMPVDAQAGNVSALVAFGVTDSSGRYRIEGIGAGTYYITAGLVGQPTFYPGVATPTGAKAVTVAQGASMTGLDFKIVTTLSSTLRNPLTPPTPPPTFSVAGRLDLKPGQQLPANLQVRGTPVRADGSFELSLQAGTYAIRTNLSYFSRPVNVVITDKNITGVILEVPFTGRVNVSLESRTGSLAEPISVAFVDVANPDNRIGVSSNRAFELELPEGDYRVIPEKLAEGYRFESASVLRVSRTDIQRLVITVTAEPRPDLPAPATTPALREVSGRVESGGRVANALVGLRFSDASGPRATVMVDASLPEPAFKVALPPGDYKVEAVLPAMTNQPNPFRVKSVTYGSSDILSAPLRITAESTGEIRIAIGLDPGP